MEGQSPEGFSAEVTKERKVPGLLDKVRANSPVDVRRFLTTIAPDVLDNVTINQVPKEARVEGDNSNVTEQLLPLSARKALLEQTKEWEVGKSVGIVAIAGFKDTCTAHPHVYEISKTERGLRLSFVDPEPTLKHKLRPPIVNLLAAEIHDDDATSMDIAFLRYRTPEFNPSLMTLTPQYAITDRLLTDKGKPGFLNNSYKAEGAKEEQILFRLSSTPSASELQMRYATPEQMQEFLGSGTGQAVITEKIRAGRHILARFMPLLESEEVFEAAHFSSKAASIKTFERFRPRFNVANVPTPAQMSESRSA